MQRTLVLAFAGSFLAACVSQQRVDVRPILSDSIDSRIGVGLRPEDGIEGRLLAEGIRIDDGISESDAAAIALWNNAAFQADLTALGFGRAELIQAGMLRNPILSLLFPIGPKQLEALASLPFEAFWLRPRRVHLAELNLDRIAQDLIQNGLDLVFEARSAHAEAILAIEMAVLAAEASRLNQKIAEITSARLSAGDVSALDRNIADSEARISEEEARRAQYEVVSAEARLRLVLGLINAPAGLDPIPSSIEVPEIPAIDQMLEEASSSRPDLRAAELAVEAAGALAGLARAQVLQLAVGLDVNSQGSSGFEAGPRIDFTLPVLNRNEGAQSLASAELDRAARAYVALQHQIASEVLQARARFKSAAESLRSWRVNILPPLEDAFRQTKLAYSDGEVSFLAVLESNRRLVDARFNEVQAAAEFRKSRADLERSSGRNRFGS